MSSIAEQHGIAALARRVALTSAVLLAGASALVTADASAGRAPSCGGKAATIVSAAPVISGTPRPDVIVVRGETGSRVSGGRGHDLICGGPGPDRLFGGAGRDRIAGSRGDDLLDGGSGRDRLDGGPGVDRLLFTPKADQVVRAAGDFYNGRRRRNVIKLKRGARALPTGAVRSVTELGAGRQRVVLAASVPRPRRGSVLVAAATATTPGLLARVETVSSAPGGGVRVDVRPAALEDAYTRLDVAFAGTVPRDHWHASVRRAPRASPAVGRAAGSRPICDPSEQTSVGREVVSSFGMTFDPGVEFRGSVDLEPKANTGYVEFDVWGRSTSLDFALALNCSQTFTGPPIPVAGPLTVTPKLVLSVSLEGKLSLKPRFYVGFIAGRRSGGWGAPAENWSSWNKGFAMAPTEATGSGSATAELKFFMALAGRVGANVGIGTTAEVHATATADESCVDATISAFAAGSVELDYWISSWEPIRLMHTFASTPAHHWCVPRLDGPTPDPGPGSDPSPPPVIAPPARARRSLLIPISGGSAGHVDLAWLSPAGTVTNITNTDDRSEGNASVSPDGTQIVYEDGDVARSPISQIAIMDRDGTKRRVLATSSSAMRAGWSPDGSKIVFMHAFELWTINSDGTGATRLLDAPYIDMYPTWSPDGTRIAFVRIADSGSGITYRAAVVDVASGLVHDFPSVGQVTRVAWSPDSARLAIASQSAGMYVTPADHDAATLVFSTPVHEVAWSPGGDRLAFIAEGVQSTRPDGSDLRDQGAFAWAGQGIAYDTQPLANGE